MRALFLISSFFVVTMSVACASDVKVFIAPRSSLVPASGKVVFDVYWFNTAEQPKAIPNNKSYSFTQVIDSRSGQSLGRATGSAIVVDHPDPDRVIPARTMLHEQIVEEVRITANEFAEVYARFRGTRCGTFKSNSVILTKRR
jgi:hypothetical protein